MRTNDRVISLRPVGADYEIRVIGGRSRPLRDFYHALLRMQWPATLCVITGGFMLGNTLFAVLYYVVGGVANARPGSFADAFFFSVETMGTIGYGAMYPSSTGANWLMVIESVVGVVLTALTTGLVFAKFSRPSARIVFSQHAVLTPIDNVPTVMFRLGNERGNSIVDATFRGIVTRTEHTAEGMMIYRVHDLKFVRSHALTLNRSFSLSHRIEPGSPFYAQTPESIVAQEYEMQVIVVGLDDTVMQTVHASHVFYPKDMLWGWRLSDVLSEASDGATVLDLRKFHDVEPSQVIEGFPYPAQ
jgi:inward rectifier potassium channel